MTEYAQAFRAVSNRVYNDVQQLFPRQTQKFLSLRVTLEYTENMSMIIYRPKLDRMLRANLDILQAEEAIVTLFSYPLQQAEPMEPIHCRMTNDAAPWVIHLVHDFVHEVRSFLGFVAIPLTRIKLSKPTRMSNEIKKVMNTSGNNGDICDDLSSGTILLRTNPRRVSVFNLDIATVNCRTMSALLFERTRQRHRWNAEHSPRTK